MTTATIEKPITYKRLADRVRELAAEHPTKISGCAYRDYNTGEPCCIVGTALHDFGVKVPKEHNLVRVSNLAPKVFGIGRRSDKWIAWLHRVQELQDNGRSWGKAVSGADAEGLANV